MARGFDYGVVGCKSFELGLAKSLKKMLRGDFGGRDVYLIGSGFEFLAGDFGDLVCYFDVEAFLCVDSLEVSV